MFCFLHSLNNHSYDGHNSCRLIISIETMFIIGTIIKKSRKKWRKIKSNTPTWDSGRPIYFSLYDLTYNKKKKYLSWPSNDNNNDIHFFLVIQQSDSYLILWVYDKDNSSHRCHLVWIIHLNHIKSDKWSSCHQVG